MGEIRNKVGALRRGAALVIAFAALFAALFAVPAAGGAREGGETGKKKPANILYVVEGDSYSRGTGADGLNGFARRYGGRTEEDLGRRVRIDQRAIGGRTSAELLGYLRSAPGAREALASADVVTVYIGYNDLHRARSSYRPDGCGGRDNRRCYREMVRRFDGSYPKLLDLVIRAAPRDATVLTGTIPYPDVRRDGRTSAVGGIPDARVHAAYVEQINRRIKGAAARRKVPVADVHRKFNGPSGKESPVAKGLISEDRIHPNDRGHAVIAGLFHELGYGDTARAASG